VAWPCRGLGRPWPDTTLGWVVHGLYSALASPGRGMIRPLADPAVAWPAFGLTQLWTVRWPGLVMSRPWTGLAMGCEGNGLYRYGYTWIWAGPAKDWRDRELYSPWPRQPDPAMGDGLGWCYDGLNRPMAALPMI
jgi:hypothetical protein